MESIIEAMGAIVAGLEYLREATAGETQETAAHTLELAELVRDKRQEITASPEETAEVMASGVRAALRPVEEGKG